MCLLLSCVYFLFTELNFVQGCWDICKIKWDKILTTNYFYREARGKIREKERELWRREKRLPAQAQAQKRHIIGKRREKRKGRKKVKKKNEWREKQSVDRAGEERCGDQIVSVSGEREGQTDPDTQQGYSQSTGHVTEPNSVPASIIT